MRSVASKAPQLQFPEKVAKVLPGWQENIVIYCCGQAERFKSSPHNDSKD